MATRKMKAAVDMAKRRAKKLSPERRSEIASEGAAARHDSLTAEERKEIASKAGKASAEKRWGKKGKKSNEVL